MDGTKRLSSDTIRFANSDRKREAARNRQRRCRAKKRSVRASQSVESTRALSFASGHSDCYMLQRKNCAGKALSISLPSSFSDLIHKEAMSLLQPINTPTKCREKTDMNHASPCSVDRFPVSYDDRSLFEEHDALFLTLDSGNVKEEYPYQPPCSWLGLTEPTRTHSDELITAVGAMLALRSHGSMKSDDDSLSGFGCAKTVPSKNGASSYSRHLTLGSSQHQNICRSA
jgi:hypothetical protein